MRHAKFCHALLVAALITACQPHVRAYASGQVAGTGTDAGMVYGSPDGGVGEAGDGMNIDAPGLDGSAGMDATEPDGSGGMGGVDTTPQYGEDAARRQEDSELFRFTLIAALALWAGRGITGRRAR
ncbi:MAG: hypothetical protein K2P87_02345 [Lachnospiraceae bacterium]|nr:hypothetical protein [Lachnospiraceae bacterium]